MAVQTEVWARDIKEQLFPDDSWVARSESDDAFVDNKTVHRPVAGALPTVERNRSTIPATPAGRTDVTVDYDLSEFTSTPTLIKDIEEIETSYEKRASVLRQHVRQQNLYCANWLQYVWSATDAAGIIRTTGADRVAQVTGATGNRKAITLDEFFAAAALLDDMDVPEEGRVVLLPSFMYNDLLASEYETLLRLEFTGKARLTGRDLRELAGFAIYKRGKKNVLSYTNAATPVPRDPAASALTTANAAALFWHPEFVCRAKGMVKAYADENKPEYYGSIFSTMVRAGGAKCYTDGTGVVAVVEAAGA
jgi:hypothetical protein